MTAVINQRAAPALEVASPLIEMRGIEKVYRTGKLEFTALRGVDLVILPGEMVAVVGPSGSGKTTILNMITGIDRPTAGTVVVDGADLGALDEEALARWRGATVGIVFQFFQLLPTLSALENAALPMDFARRWKARDRSCARPVPPGRRRFGRQGQPSPAGAFRGRAAARSHRPGAGVRPKPSCR